MSTRQKTLSYILKVIVILSALVGTFLSAYAGRTVFMYFTIQSSIALAIVCGIGFYYLLKNKSITDLWYVIKFVATISITLTGAVFCFVLAPTMGKYAWNFQNILTHVVVPVASIIDFFVVAVKSYIKKRNTFGVIALFILLFLVGWIYLLIVDGLKKVIK